MPYGSMWKGLAGAFGAVQPAIQDYQKRQQIEEEQRQRQQSVNQEAERIGLSRKELEFRQKEAEDKDFFEKAQMLQPGQPLPADIRAGLDQRQIPYYVDEQTGMLLNPIRTGAETQDYELRKRGLELQGASQARADKAHELANRRETALELDRIQQRYNQERAQIPNMIKAIQAGIPGPTTSKEIAQLQREWRTLNPRYRILFKKAGLSDEEIAQIFPEGGGASTSNPIADAIGQWIQQQK